MTETILALLIAVRTVESCDGLDPRAKGNDLQITRQCVEDVNRIYRTRYNYPQCTRNKEDAENIYFLYLSYWGMQRFHQTGRIPSAEELARIWNGGPRGNEKPATKKYARKIRKVMR